MHSANFKRRAGNIVLYDEQYQPPPKGGGKKAPTFAAEDNYGQYVYVFRNGVRKRAASSALQYFACLLFPVTLPIGLLATAAHLVSTAYSLSLAFESAGSHVCLQYGDFRYPLATIRSRGAAINEGTGYLQDPVFSNCTVPVVWYPFWMANFGHFLRGACSAQPLRRILKYARVLKEAAGYDGGSVCWPASLSTPAPLPYAPFTRWCRQRRKTVWLLGRYALGRQHQVCSCHSRRACPARLQLSAPAGAHAPASGDVG